MKLKKNRRNKKKEDITAEIDSNNEPKKIRKVFDKVEEKNVKSIERYIILQKSLVLEIGKENKEKSRIISYRSFLEKVWNTKIGKEQKI